MAGKYLSNEDIIALTTLGERDVDIPALGGLVRMRSCTLTQRDDARLRAIRASGDAKEPSGSVFTVWLIHYSLVEPVLSAEAVDRLPQVALDQLFRKALEVNGLDKEVSARVEQSFPDGRGQDAPGEAVTQTGKDPV